MREVGRVAHSEVSVRRLSLLGSESNANLRARTIQIFIQISKVCDDNLEDYSIVVLSDHGNTALDPVRLLVSLLHWEPYTYHEVCGVTCR